MLLPKFSMRLLLLLMVVAGFVFFILAQAIQGQAWAIAVSVAILSLLLAFLIYAAIFVIAIPISLMGESLRNPPMPASPFATERPPPQIMPPPEPE